jgi:hypothetical protein
MRKGLGEFALGDRDGRARPIEKHGARRGRALVEGKQQWAV